MTATRILESIDEVSPAAWNALVPPESRPLLEHGYLAALERSGALARGELESRHATVWSGDRLVAAAPCYLKRGPRADPMPDWARAIAERNELPYYPTLCICVPYVKHMMPKLMTAAGEPRGELVEQLIAAGKDLAQVIDCYGSTRDEVELLERLGFAARVSPHHAWVNDGYDSFEAFLARVSQKRRHEIRRERRRVADAGIRVRTVRGAELDCAVADLMWQGHERTIGKHGEEFDLYPREFFALVAELQSDRAELYLAERGDRPIGAALCLASDRVLHVGWWGSLEPAPLVHFEVGLYHPMELAIARGVPLVELNGPGDQKLRRGCTPIGLQHSAIWIGDGDLREATSVLLAKERAWMTRHLEEQQRRSPIKPRS